MYDHDEIIFVRTNFYFVAERWCASYKVEGSFPKWPIEICMNILIKFKILLYRNKNLLFRF